MTVNTTPKRECFVIAPIGIPGSPTRKRSDLVLSYIVDPALQECGYAAVRADQLSENGSITNAIVEHLINAPLVIADLTEYNPNVFYKLAVRHAAKGRVIPIIETGNAIPFDVAPYRTVTIDSSNIDTDFPKAKRLADELVRHVKGFERETGIPESPLSWAVHQLRLKSETGVGFGADKHYRRATELVRGAKTSIILCQRTSTLLLGPESARVPESPFRDELLAALERGVVVYHLIHLESCLADIWMMPTKFGGALGTLPTSDRLFIRRYQGFKPVPRLLVVDDSILSCVYDVDQMQFFSIVDAPEVEPIAQEVKRFLNEAAVVDSSPERLLEQLRTARKASDEVHATGDRFGARNVFARHAQSSFEAAGHDPGKQDHLLETTGDVITIPLAWPDKKLGVFFDPPTLDNESFERDAVWRNINGANEMGWRTLFFSRNELLLHLEDVLDKILHFVE
jgi:hypothetical protein